MGTSVQPEQDPAAQQDPRFFGPQNPNTSRFFAAPPPASAPLVQPADPLLALALARIEHQEQQRQVTGMGSLGSEAEEPNAHLPEFNPVAIVKHLAVGVARVGEMFLGAQGPAFIAEDREELEEMVSQGIPRYAIETPEEISERRTGTALVASSLAFGPALQAATKGLQAAGTVPVVGSLTRLAPDLIAKTTAAAGSGAVFGAIRDRHGDESLLSAITTDALLFGGLHLAGSLVARGVRGAFPPLELPTETILAAEQSIKEGGASYGRTIYEEINTLSKELVANDLAEAAAKEISAGTATIRYMQKPGNVGFVRRFFRSPSTHQRLAGPVGDAFGRVVNNGIERQQVAYRLWQESDLALRQAKKLVRESVGPGASRATRTKAEVSFGKLLDTIFTKESLPAGTHPKVAEAFGLIRNRLNADREALRLLQGGAPDWGIDAYLPHVFVGEYAITNAGTKAFLGAATPSRLRATLEELQLRNPGVMLEVAPKSLQLPAELAGAEGYLRGTKFFSHTLRRTSNLEGFEGNPFVALDIYNRGVARKIAFHDFAQKAGAVRDALAGVPHTKGSLTALDEYINAVMGRPGPIEESMQATVEALAGRIGQAVEGVTRSPTLGAQAEMRVATALAPRNVGRLITTVESMARLGYSPPAIVINLSQTAINTATKIGWPSTLRGINLLTDKSQRGTVDALLRQMNLELEVPLTQAGNLTITAARQSRGRFAAVSPLYWFNKAETVNRGIAGLARYQQAISQGVSHDEAIVLARRFIRETNFEYSIADTPALMRGPVGGAAFQFQKFVVKELEFIAGLSPKEAARFAVNVQLAAGLPALLKLPPFVIADWLSGKISDETLSEKAEEAFPRFSRGLPGLAGVDITGSIAIEAPDSWGDIFGPGPKDAVAAARILGHETVMRLMPAAMRDKLRQGVELSEDERLRLYRQLEPVMMRRVFDAMDVAESQEIRRVQTLPGLGTIGSGEVIARPDDPDKEFLTTLVGFQSLGRTAERRAMEQTRKITAQVTNQLEVVYQRWAQAYFVEGDRSKANTVIQDAQNRELPITQQGFQRAAQRVLLTRGLRAGKRTPRALRGEVFEQLRPFF